MKTFDNILKNILKEMENGVMPWECPWVEKGLSPWPSNAVSKAHYSGLNIILLWHRARKSGYSKNNWLTFNQARDNNIKVIKGSSSERLLRMVAIPTDKVKTPLVLLSANHTIEDGKEVVLLPKWFNVFNIEDCDLSESQIEFKEPELIERPSSWKVERLNAHAAAIGVKVVTTGNLALYNSNQDIIKMPDCPWRSEEDYCATLAHEIIHSTGADSRTGRHAEIKHMFTKYSDEYAFEELVAEIGAAFFCAELGIKGQLQGHASYIEHWLEALKNQRQYLTKATFFAQQAFEHLSATLAGKQDAA